MTHTDAGAARSWQTLRGAARLDDFVVPKVSAAVQAAKKTISEQVGARLTRHRDIGPQRYDPQEVAAAWEELRSLPELNWVPPLWRAANSTPEARKSERQHALSALDQNLKLDVTAHPDGVCIRIATGPLTDRATSAGADPLAPSAALHPDLDVTADSFEQAVLLLRAAARKVYGERAAPSGTDALRVTRR